MDIRANISSQHAALSDVAAFFAEGSLRKAPVASKTASLSETPAVRNTCSVTRPLASESSTKLRVAGNALFSCGNTAAAIDLYSQSIAAAKEDGDMSAALALAFANRCAAHLKCSAWDAAVDDASSALRLDPLSVKSWRRRAAAHNALGRHAAAARDLDVASHVMVAAGGDVHADAERTAWLMRIASRHDASLDSWKELPILVSPE